MNSNFVTNRLSLSKIILNDASFILELVNTEEWIKFIGNRNINNLEDAKNYIQKILLNENTKYWTVIIKETGHPIGVVTLLKREDLEFLDIGFAFLDDYQNKGYAFEAVSEIVNHALNKYNAISAITLPHNHASIKLLQKLDFHHIGNMNREDQELLHYQIQLSSL